MGRIVSRRVLWTGLLMPVIVALALMAGGSDVARADPGSVTAGHDLLETVSEQGNESYINFACQPLPADFFGPGSDPFDGRVAVQGDPFDTFGGFGALSPTDTIWERLADTGETFPAMIPVEVVKMSLVSAEPLLISFDGGMAPPQVWAMRVQVQDGEPDQGPGTMNVRHEGIDGGTFDMQLNVVVDLIFTQLDPPGGMTATYEDYGPLEYQAVGEPWCHTANPLDVPSGQVVIQKPGLTTNFFPGIVCGPPRTKTVVELHADLAQCDFAQHNVRAAERAAEPPAVGGIAEAPNADASALGTAESSGGASGTTYAAIAGLAAAVLLAAGGWYARRRRRAG